QPLPRAGTPLADQDGAQHQVDHGPARHPVGSASGSGISREPSHGRSRPASSSRRDSSPAGKPQMNSPPAENPGPTYPLGWLTWNRFAGSTSSASGTRTTAGTSSWSTGAPGVRGGPPATNGVPTE